MLLKWKSKYPWKVLAMSDMPPRADFNLMEWRERFIRTVLRLAAVFGIVILSVAFPTASDRDRILFLVLYLVLAGITIFPAPYSLRAGLLLLMTGMVGMNAILSWGPWADGNLFLLAAVILAALLLDSRVDLVVLTTESLLVALVGVSVLTGTTALSAADAPGTTLTDWGVYLIDFIVIGAILLAASNMLKSAFVKTASQMQSSYEALASERQTLEEKIKERTLELEMNTVQLRAATSAARSIAETQDVSSLLTKAADLIAEKFEFQHVGLFLLDEQRFTAFLQASSSENGKRMLGQGLRVDPDRNNPLARSVETRQAVIMTDSEKTQYAQDPNFPGIRSRLVLPLTVRGSLIGMLDIHSDQPHAISTDDREVLQTLADLIAISFDNVRLIEETRALISQLNAGSAVQAQNTWSKFTSRQKNAYQYTPAGVRPVFAQGAREQEGEGFRIPIVLQGQEIGRIKLKRKGYSSPWTDRERSLVEKIAIQAALALENSRLVDEAQKNALRNQMIANFSTYVRETLDVESVVRSAAAEFRKVFDLKEAEVLIGISQNDSPNPPVGKSSSS